MSRVAPFRVSQAPSRPRLTLWQRMNVLPVLLGLRGEAWICEAPWYRAWRGGRWVQWENPSWICALPASSWWRGNDPRRSGRVLAVERYPDWKALGHA